jgi:hypothetical protein
MQIGAGRQRQESHLGAFAPADPVALHRLHIFGPAIQFIQVVQQQPEPALFPGGLAGDWDLVYGAGDQHHALKHERLKIKQYDFGHKRTIVWDVG